MERILVIFYSQSGDVRQCARSFVGPIEHADAEVTWIELKPQDEYPSPWKKIPSLLGVMPECITESPPEICAPEIPLDQRFDLIVFAYQVWFLSPSLPVQAFFRTPQAETLHGTKVITITVSRNMWHNGSETMKRLLANAGAVHIDNIVVTHQGPPIATFVTTTRALLSGKRDRAMRVMPKAGIAEKDFERLAQLGETLAGRLEEIDNPESGSVLRDANVVEVHRESVLPELCGWYCFRMWGRTIRFAERIWKGLRHVGLFLFGFFLLFMILIGIPLTLLSLILVLPWIRGPLNRYIAKLKSPAESPLLNEIA